MTCPECGSPWESQSAINECATIDRVEARQARNASRRSVQRASLPDSEDD